ELAAGLWIGSLFVLLVAGLSTVLASPLPTERRGALAARMVNAFSPLALGAAAVLATFGVITAVRHGKHVANLWSTSLWEHVPDQAGRGAGGGEPRRLELAPGQAAHGQRGGGPDAEALGAHRSHRRRDRAGDHRGAGQPARSALAMSGLARRLGRFDATMIVMGGIVGSGIFMNPYVVARQVHTPFLILAAWAAGGLIALAGAFLYAELSSRRPDVGGQY